MGILRHGEHRTMDEQQIITVHDRPAEYWREKCLLLEREVTRLRIVIESYAKSALAAEIEIRELKRER